MSWQKRKREAWEELFKNCKSRTAGYLDLLLPILREISKDLCSFRQINLERNLFIAHKYSPKKKILVCA